MMSPSPARVPRGTVLDVFRQEQRLYRHIAYSLCRSADDAEDALQNAAINLLVRQQPSVHVNLSQWIARVVTNACLDLHRSNKRTPATYSNDTIADHPEVSPWMRKDTHSTLLSDPLSTLHSDFGEVTDGVWPRLTSQQRSIIDLMDVLGLSVAEASWLLNLKEGTVKSRHQRAKKRAQSLLVA